MREKTPQTSCQQPNRGISVITPLPSGEGLGGGGGGGGGGAPPRFPLIMNKTSFLFVHYKKSVIFAPVNLNQSIYV